MYCLWEITGGLREYWPGRCKEDKEETRNEVWKEVERVTKQKNLTPEDAINRQIWQKATENQ
jgi:hypothetical protein